MTQQRADSPNVEAAAAPDPVAWALREQVEQLTAQLAESEARYRIRNLEAIAFEKDLEVKTAYVDAASREVAELRESVAWLQGVVSNLSSGATRAAIIHRAPKGGETRQQRRQRQMNAAYEELCKHPQLLSAAQRLKRLARPNQP